jgi:N-acyl homoserine lactone hydrolase
MLIESFRNSKVAKLYVMDYGLFQVHSNSRIIGITGSLLETDDGKWVLVDTGFAPKYIEDREKSSREDKLDEFGTILELGPENLYACTDGGFQSGASARQAALLAWPPSF